MEDADRERERDEGEKWMERGIYSWRCQLRLLGNEI